MNNFKRYAINRCDVCGKEGCETTMERVPNKGTKKLCRRCAWTLDDYWDNKREDEKIRDRFGDD